MKKFLPAIPLFLFAFSANAHGPHADAAFAAQHGIAHVAPAVAIFATLLCIGLVLFALLGEKS